MDYERLMDYDCRLLSKSYEEGIVDFDRNITHVKSKELLELDWRDYEPRKDEDEDER